MKGDIYLIYDKSARRPMPVATGKGLVIPRTYYTEKGARDFIRAVRKNGIRDLCMIIIELPKGK